MESKRKESIQVWSERRVKEKEKKKDEGVEIREKKKIEEEKEEERKAINYFKRTMTSSLASGSIISKLVLGQKKIPLSNVLPHKAS